MAAYLKADAINKIEETGLIPLFYHMDPTVCIEVVRSVFDAGCSVIEFTNRGDAAINSFSKIIEFSRTNYPEALVGAGSINDPYIASHFISMGADFIVGPSYNEQVARLCNKHQVLYVPGCATVTEMMAAAEMGLNLIKIFPAGSLGGPDFIKAIRGPLPWIKTIPTGGVDTTKDDLKKWFEVGATAVGLGSNLISKKILDSADYSTLQDTTAQLLDTIADLRNK